jgi:hypothetical protein
MKYTALLSGVAALALSACSGGEDPTPAASETIAAEATDAAAPAPAGDVAFTAGAAPSKEFVVGKWGEKPDCALPMTFNADGTITDGPTDKWSLTGDSLDLGGLFKMTVKVIDADTMEALNEGGGKTELMRCS